ncbi:hypothetical protein ACFWIB_04355 [Streptomyces sp. NPDC127051]|uniref:hypothetical protein n=1 Tax=Streptomyces sp. NPDC127051 TaxID=3347119 RepID=UPI00364F6270
MTGNGIVLRIADTELRGLEVALPEIDLSTYLAAYAACEAGDEAAEPVLQIRAALARLVSHPEGEWGLRDELAMTVLLNGGLADG